MAATLILKMRADAANRHQISFGRFFSVPDVGTEFGMEL